MASIVDETAAGSRSMDDGVTTSHGLGADLLFWVMRANRCLLEQSAWVWDFWMA
jgi:hypothetical protein